jgi:hypothetical protein
LFDVEDSATEQLMRNCATDSGKAFIVDDASGLVAAFGQIGSSLTQFRLTR